MNTQSIDKLTEEIKDLRATIEDLTKQVQELQLERKTKVPGVYDIGDKVIVLTSGRIGKSGDIARVTKIGKRISIIVNGQHTNRHPTNLKHVIQQCN
jgi:hypothetical protein